MRSASSRPDRVGEGDRLWLGEQPPLLASTSPTRLRLLAAAGLAVDREAPGVDEAALAAAWDLTDPALVATGLAAAKARAVAERRPGRVVIGSDQVLWCEGAIFSKATSLAVAAEHLRRLVGRSHRLVSAAAVAVAGEPPEIVTDEAEMTMRPLHDAAIDTYLQLAGPSVLHSVGCYEAEGLGAHLFERVGGDYATILGLPLRPLLDALRRRRLLAF